MNPTMDASLRSWPADPWLTATLLLSGGIYLRGWLELHRRDPARWSAGRLVAFAGGLAAIFLALASPLEPFASLLLQIHMLQHLLLMMVAPPLLWAAWPLFPMVRGLPEPIRTYWVAPLLRSPGLRRCFARMTHPLVAWPLYVGTTWLWHVPRAYELALSRDAWHVAEHLCFTASALLFWYPVVRPYPSRPRWSRWLLVPYLILADVQNTVLSAWLTFSSTVLYPHYASVPRINSLSALEDQSAAGVMMWIPGSVMFLVPLFTIGVGLLAGSKRARNQRPAEARQRQLATASAQLPILGQERPARRGFDLLQIPWLGRFLRWRFSRRIAQTVLALIAVVIIVDGLRGPQASPMNLAGVVPWIHWRGLLIVGLLAGGNFFCFACPFTLPRTLAGRWLPRGRAWPRWLRSKWLATALVALFLWSYEAWALWDSPWLTAVITLTYFAAAFVVDGVFQGGSFCKYVCPIGQFNFVQSLVSPLEVKVRDPAVCSSCTTQECIRGSGLIAGCQTHLFQPRKRGNLDCTFCLDCARACPHQNVGVLAVAPGQTLWTDPMRSGLGRFSRRPDLAALVLVLVFGAFANAAGMVAPVVAWQDAWRARLGDPPRVMITTAGYLLALVVLPLTVVVIATVLSRAVSRSNESWLTTATRFSFALVPIGFGMWLAHYSFHLLTSYDTVVPAWQRFATDLGWQGWADPEWQRSCCQPVADWVPRIEILMLDFGLLLSLYTALRIAETQATRASQALKAVSPWAVMIVLLFVFGVWIVLQPMEMRGTLPVSG
jgi:cytochrome c oxidase assembly factor CtaG